MNDIINLVYVRNIKSLMKPTHRALGDVKALEQLYIKMCEQFSFHRKMEQNYFLNNPEMALSQIYLFKHSFYQFYLIHVICPILLITSSTCSRPFFHYHYHH